MSSEISSTERPPSLLRFSTMGSVDSGKSTLIGRLLLDTDSVYHDQLQLLKGFESSEPPPVSALALLTDGLAAEREQNITIDVAYRYFSTSSRHFILADAPGHEQYTRNMATAASTADLALLVIDAVEGLTTQTKRHAFIAALLGVPRFLVAINKMDACAFAEKRFHHIVSMFSLFAERLSVRHIQFIPVSARTGANVASPAKEMPWYAGETVLQYLTEIYTGGDVNTVDFRLPVQYVLKPVQGDRRYAGQIVSGSISVGAEVFVLPSMRKTKVTGIEIGSATCNRATTRQSVSISLADHLDISRGDMIVRAGNIPTIQNTFEAMLVWMDAHASQTGRPYHLYHTTRTVKAFIDTIDYVVDVENLSRTSARPLELNDIGRVRLTATKPVLFDPYEKNRSTGSFILVDPESHTTVAAGMIINRVPAEMLQKAGPVESLDRVPISTNIRREAGAISQQDREQRFNQRSTTVWLTGLPSAGKSTIATTLEQTLFAAGSAVYRLDGDNLRFGLNRDLGFGAADRSENIRRVAEVARLFNDAGLIVVCSFISPFQSDRELARSIVGPKNFFEVFVDTPLEICEQRDPKGLYKRARAGEIRGFTGVSAPYEPPTKPHLVLPTSSLSVEECVQAILALLPKP